MKSAPCKDCKDRVLYCHSTCERYKMFKDECELISKKKKESEVIKAFLGSKDKGGRLNGCGWGTS